MNTYLFAAYSIFMVILFTYFFLISRRTKEAEEKIEELEETIEEIKRDLK